MWNDVWNWLIDNHVFHSVVVAAVCIILFVPGKRKHFFKRVKKIGPAGLELTDPDIDPATPCPYTKSRDETFCALRTTDQKVEKLSVEVQKVISIVENMRIDQQKQSFYDMDQPDAERLAAGLKYVFFGGNGKTKPDVKEFADKHPDLYNALTSANPDLRLKEDKK